MSRMVTAPGRAREYETIYIMRPDILDTEDEIASDKRKKAGGGDSIPNEICVIFAPGTESLEVRLFAWDEIPWGELAFPSVRWVLDAWTGTWLHPEFASWSLDATLPQVRCPTLAIHGLHDEYGSLIHPETIGRLGRGKSRVEIVQDASTERPVLPLGLADDGHPAACDPHDIDLLALAVVGLTGGTRRAAPPPTDLRGVGTVGGADPPATPLLELDGSMVVQGGLHLRVVQGGAGKAVLEVVLVGEDEPEPEPEERVAKVPVPRSTVPVRVDRQVPVDDLHLLEGREVPRHLGPLGADALADLVELLVAGGERLEDREVHVGLPELLLENRPRLVEQRRVPVEDLAGHDGARHVIKDRLGRVVESVGDTIPAVDGQSIRLSIDAKIQFYAYQRIRDAVKQHKAKAGSVVVLDAVTGEVLALANVPSYTPDDRRNLTGAQLRNRALTDTFEPGSTMKPIIAALALETRRVRPDSVIATAPGRLTIDGSTISDSHPHGDLTVEEVIQKSSNVGTAKLALQMQPREMWEIYTAVGLGQKPQIGFPGVVTGRLRPHKTWRRIEQVTMSYGYGLSASLFQMARSYTVFANGGRVIPATLLKTDEPAVGVPVFSERTADQVRKMLQMAAGPGGTGQKAQTVGYSVGGKSGTARKQVGKSYAAGKYRAWFTGLAPVDKPRIIVAVMVDEPSAGQVYGGLVAAPVFSEVVQQTLRMMNVQPDMAVKPQIVANPVEESL